ncbi:MAG: VWA domain-containing protein [Candidatus Hydrogenedentes bacterium]|nr:VWA domain-containing protein [Candidatus Hydrogenedentota bacterium]
MKRIASVRSISAYLITLLGCLVFTPASSAGEPAGILPGGCLQVVDTDFRPQGSCPLKHTDVQVDISGFVARVTLTQQFGNPFTEPIEAVYTFPMSDRAAVDSMVMQVGDRTVRGIIKRREEARQIYEAAKHAGKAASLLDQERPNIFTQSVANIRPGDQIVITISYVELLKYEEGEYEFSFPMVVGPRYIPGSMLTPTGTDQVPDANRITPPVTPEGTRAGHDISLEVHLDAGVPIRALNSVLHEVDTEQPSDSCAVVRMRNRSEIPNRDFVLHYKVAGEQIGDAVLVHADERGGFFTLILQPPDRVAPQFVTPKEMIFVIDCSGSMRGFPIEKAKATMRMCIEQMNPQDTFNLVSFAGGLGYCFDRPVINSHENRSKALTYLNNLEGSGGTEMMPAIRAALERQGDPERLRVVCFLTDGFIGNDMEIIDAVQKNARTARVFAFGIGNGVNRFLIDGMARAGRGAAEVVTLESAGDAAVQRFHQRIHSPLLTDISVDFGGLSVYDVYPDVAAIPDLFSAQPLILKGRYTQPGSGVITLRGETAQGPFERRVSVDLMGRQPEHDALASFWARARIDYLMEQDWLGIQRGNPDNAIKETIAKLGLEFNLVTQFTSFVAVEERQITEGGTTKTVQVPVEMTDGVSYEGVFGEQSQPARLQTLGYFRAAAAKVASVPMLNAPASPTTGQVQVDSLTIGGKPAAFPAEPRRTTSREVAQPVAHDEEKDISSLADRSEQGGARQDRDARQGHKKLDPALWNLSPKLVNGAYSDDKVTVENGWVKVLIRVSDDPATCVGQLTNLAVNVISRRDSNKTILAKVRVADLEKIADLAFVVRIEPSKP